MGVANYATLSTGEVFTGPKPHKHQLNKIRVLNRRLSKKQRGSKNSKKARKQLAKRHWKVANVREDYIHKFTTNLTRRFHTISIEHLNVRGMMRNRHLSRSIADMGFYETRRQLEYKTAMRGAQLVVANRFYPSSKLCSDCGYKMKDMPLKVRNWTCPQCGSVHDRDVNAAINLMKLAVSSTASACGEASSVVHASRASELVSAKQEARVNRFSQK